MSTVQYQQQQKTQICQSSKQNRVPYAESVGYDRKIQVRFSISLFSFASMNRYIFVSAIKID